MAHTGSRGRHAAPRDDRDTRGLRRIALASLIGTSIEWYDFFLYATMAALVFNRVFFPSLDDTAGTLASFATFGAGFVARPIGGVVMGHFGDRRGRKSAMVASLVLMGLATFAIGLVPTYASIGVAAPALLTGLRFVQGLALGGEWAGAVTLAMEHAPARRRAWWAAWVQYGALGGIVLSSGTVLLLAETLNGRQLVTWGWRVPFLASGLLLAVGLFVRLRVLESPVFAELDSHGQKARVPLVQAVRGHGTTVLRVSGMHLVVVAFATTLMTFYVSYGVRHAGYTRTEMLQALFLGTLATAVLAPFLGSLSDVVGRRRTYVIGTALAMVGVFPSFVLLDRGGLPSGIAAILCVTVPLTVTYQAQGAWFPELFPPASRVTGAGLGAQFATVLVGGPAPIVAEALLVKGHGRPWWVAAYLCGLAFTSLVSALLSPETAPSRVPPPAALDDDDLFARWDAAKAPARPPVERPAPTRAGSVRR